jgi:hypothetical protein
LRLKQQVLRSAQDENTFGTEESNLRRLPAFVQLFDLFVQLRGDQVALELAIGGQ